MSTTTSQFFLPPIQASAPGTSSWTWTTAARVPRCPLLAAEPLYGWDAPLSCWLNLNTGGVAMCRGGRGEAQRGRRSKAAKSKWMRSRGAGGGGRSRYNFLQAAREPWQRESGFYMQQKQWRSAALKSFAFVKRSGFFMRSAVATQGLPSNILFQVWWSRKKRVR